jgi:hypothetical protein
MSLAAIQSRLKALVEAEPLLEDRPVLIEEKGNLISILESVLETQSLAIVIAPARGEVKPNALRGRAGWADAIEVIIHRGILDGDDVPSTVAVLDALRARLHGAPVDEDKPALTAFACTAHELRELEGDAYARVLTVEVISPVS